MRLMVCVPNGIVTRVLFESLYAFVCGIRGYQQKKKKKTEETLLNISQSLLQTVGWTFTNTVLRLMFQLNLNVKND